MGMFGVYYDKFLFYCVFCYFVDDKGFGNEIDDYF